MVMVWAVGGASLLSLYRRALAVSACSFALPRWDWGVRLWGRVLRFYVGDV
jgi:hypothetical protein